MVNILKEELALTKGRLRAIWFDDAPNLEYCQTKKEAGRLSMYEFNQLYDEYTKMFDIEMRLKNGGICYNEITEKSDYEETVNL